jgi:hypothetical protein
MGKEMTERERNIRDIARIIGRTPNDLSEGEACTSTNCGTPQGGTCICEELGRDAAVNILDYMKGKIVKVLR